MKAGHLAVHIVNMPGFCLKKQLFCVTTYKTETLEAAEDLVFEVTNTSLSWQGRTQLLQEWSYKLQKQVKKDQQMLLSFYKACVESSPLQEKHECNPSGHWDLLCNGYAERGREEQQHKRLNVARYHPKKMPWSLPRVKIFSTCTADRERCL